LIVVEDKNFALFNYVNELNNQIEILQEQIVDIKKEIRRFEGQGVELEDKQRQMLEQINDKRSQATTLADEYEEKTRAARKILDQCRAGLFFSFFSFRFISCYFPGIDSLFKKIGCDRRQIEHLLQSHEGVTEDNMLRYLGIIEERTNELLSAQATINAKVSIKSRNIFCYFVYLGTKYSIT
jgi:regulator of replication initiation timing